MASTAVGEVGEDVEESKALNRNDMTDDGEDELGLLSSFRRCQ